MNYTASRIGFYAQAFGDGDRFISVACWGDMELSVIEPLGGRSSVGRASAFQAECREFESRRPLHPDKPANEGSANSEVCHGAHFEPT